MFTMFTPLAKTAEALRNGSLFIVDYVNEICDRIDEIEPKIEALIPEKNRRQRLLQEALELQQRFPNPKNRPPLYGVPVGIKDIFPVDGFPTKAGSKLPEELFAGQEAACVMLLKRAGALILGKTVTTEFAYFEPGPTRNPHNIHHTPGGSSSGSAAGVASGFFALALGTQTIGSVIRPAAFCGIIGFKPSYDRIPTEGLLFFSKSADHIGFFTQDIEGIQLAASILCRDWKVRIPTPYLSREGNLPVLGVPDGNYLAQASKEGLAAFEAHLQKLEHAGYTIKRLQMFEDIEAINYRHRRMTAAEFAKEYDKWFERYRELYRPRTLQAILEGQQVSAEELDSARAGQLALRHQLEDVQTASGVDLWISPPATGDAPEGIHATGDPIMNLPWTHAGLPTLTIPAGKSQRDLPLGLQLTAAFMQDEQLVEWARTLVKTLR